MKIFVSQPGFRANTPHKITATAKIPMGQKIPSAY